MVDRHLVTVGTSVIRNSLNLDLEEPWKDALSKLARNEAAELPEEALNFIASQVSKDPKRMSAELNALVSFYESIGFVDEVRLLCSDTEAGKISCKILKRALENGVNTSQGSLKLSVSAYVVKDLGSPKKFYSGLLNLSCCVVKELAKASEDGASLHANLTGGFKPESAYASIILFSKSPPIETVYYIHETFRELVILPVFSVSIIPDKLLQTLTKPPYNEYYADVLGGREVIREYADKMIRCLKGSYLECFKTLR